MKAFFLILFLLPTIVFANNTESQLQDQLRAEKAKVQMLIKKLQKAPKEEELANLNQFFDTKHRPTHCDDDDNDDPNYSCVTNCSSRYSNGQCYSYGNDFCGPNASCTAKCDARYSNGQCYSYGSDHCGESATCVENCTARYSNGQCYSYGADICY